MGIPMKSYSKNTKIKKFVNKVKNEFKNFFLPQMELACAGVPIKISQNEVEDEKTKNSTFFHTGKYPPKNSTGRNIMEKKEIRILDEKNDIQLHDIDEIITPHKAQKVLTKILAEKKASHEYLAFEATKMFTDEEIKRYALHIVCGAKAEDYVFMEGETIDDLFAKKPEKRYEDDKEFVKENDISNIEEKSFLKRMFRWVSKLAEVFTSNIEHDVINRPYMSHFFDPRKENGERGLDVRGGKIKFIDASTRAQKIWKLAVEKYKNGEKSKAYTYLGHFIHLVSDMHIPAHVHNDIHAPWPIDKKDSYEEWCGRNDYEKAIEKKKGKLNIAIWKDGPITPPTSRLWRISSDVVNKYTFEKIDEFFVKIATETQKFRSVDFPGTMEGQNKTGKLSDDECYEQAKVLIPKTIMNNAQVIVNFLSAIEKYKEKN